jgi:hypothetical protein
VNTGIEKPFEGIRVGADQACLLLHTEWPVLKRIKNLQVDGGEQGLRTAKSLNEKKHRLRVG